MIFLWTDTLIFLLLLVLIGIAYALCGKEHIQRPLNKITNSRVGMVSLVVLLFYVFVGLLDSIHFKSNHDNNEIISLLDYCATPLREHNEKTYSAPFATTLYSKEMVEKEGVMQWDFPRLAYGGKHLTDPESEKAGDIFQKSMIGFLLGIAVFYRFNFADFHRLLPTAKQNPQIQYVLSGINFIFLHCNGIQLTGIFIALLSRLRHR